MQFSFLSATLLAIASLATAQTAGFDAITSPAEGTVAVAGTPLEIVWQPGDVTGPITITLLQGATPSTLQLGDVVAASIENSLGKFTYNIPATAGSFATYGFQITLDAAPTTLQYSFPFSITGGASSGTSAGPSSTGASSSSATSTTTIRLTQATSTSTTEVTSTSASANVTSTAVESSTISSTTAVVTSVASSNSSSNISTTLSRGTATRTSTGGSSATGSSVATATANAAANIATGGLAMIGGLFIAFAL